MKRNYVMPRQKSLAMPEISNPFVLEQKHKFVNKLQVAVMSVTVAPVRLILFFLLLLMAWALAALGVAFLSEENKLKPLSGWRLFIHKPFVALGRAMFFVIGFYIVRTKGKRALVHAAPLLVVAPHSSMFDTLLFFLHTTLASPVSRNENAIIPLAGSML